jgi:hypothetical protein
MSKAMPEKPMTVPDVSGPAHLVMSGVAGSTNSLAERVPSLRQTESRAPLPFSLDFFSRHENGMPRLRHSRRPQRVALITVRMN